MICPNDKTEMHEVRVESHYGLPIVLDQCPTCGGMWFDKSELFMAKSGEATKVDLADAVLLATPSTIRAAKLFCPRDGADLIRFTDRFFPADIILVRCPFCGGMWLNRGEFVKFQKVREELKRSRETRIQDNKLEADVKGLLETYRSENAPGALDNLGRFLNTPVDDVNPFALDAAQEQSGSRRAIDIIMNVLSLVLGVVTRGRLF